MNKYDFYYQANDLIGKRVVLNGCNSEYIDVIYSVRATDDGIMIMLQSDDQDDIRWHWSYEAIKLMKELPFYVIEKTEERKEMSEIKFLGIQLSINDDVVTLSLEEARRLYNELAKVCQTPTLTSSPNTWCGDTRTYYTGHAVGGTCETPHCASGCSGSCGEDK